MSAPLRRLVATGFLVTALTGLGLVSAGPASAAPAPAGSAAPAAAPPTALGATPPALPPAAAAVRSADTAGSADATSRYAPKGAPPAVGVSPKSVTPAVSTYLYGTSYQYAAANGMFAYMSVERPFLSTADFHSLGELAAQSADGQQIVEIGWTVDRGLNGDVNPHLFVFHWVDRIPSCYNGCGFVAYTPATIRPGAALPSGTTQFFAIQHYQGNWWVAYGSQWIGYFPDSLWSGRYTRTGLTQWFGEVSANSGAPCTDMGNGQFSSSGTAAAISTMGFYGGPAVSKTTYATHPAYYTAVSTNATSMRYGGPGAC